MKTYSNADEDLRGKNKQMRKRGVSQFLQGTEYKFHFLTSSFLGEESLTQNSFCARGSRLIKSVVLTYSIPLHSIHNSNPHQLPQQQELIKHEKNYPKSKTSSIYCGLLNYTNRFQAAVMQYICGVKRAGHWHTIKCLLDSAVT